MGTVLVISLLISIFVTTQVLVSIDETTPLASQALYSLTSVNVHNFRPDSDSEENDIPLLTLFTTFKETHNSTFHRVAHAHAVANWASLRPAVHVVLFAQFPYSNLSEMARKAGWDLIQLKRWNDQGTPFLKDMFNTVFQRYNSTFYGFANGDILFDDSLIETLQEVKKRLKDALKNNALLIGSRTNMIFSVNDAIRTEFSKTNLASVTRKRGLLDGWFAQDYFFFTRDSKLNWSSVADVVIGRPGYDNYLVAKSIYSKVNVIDATKTLLAVHLLEKGARETGRSNPDSSYNLQLLGDVPFRKGLTIASQYVTTSDVIRRVFVARRMPPFQYRLAHPDSDITPPYLHDLRPSPAAKPDVTEGNK